MAEMKPQPQAAGLGMRLRAKNYKGKKLAEQTAEQNGAGMKKRGRGYVGLPLEKQTADHKGSAMKPRDKSYKAGEKKHMGQGKNLPYVGNYEFKIQMGGYDIKCNKISNLAVQVETEEIPEGGNNNYPNIFQSARKKADVLTIEKALVTGSLSSEFVPGCHVGETTITVLQNGEIYTEFWFEDGIITKFEYSNLDALGREVLIHKMDISHSGFILPDLSLAPLFER